MLRVFRDACRSLCRFVCAANRWRYDKTRTLLYYFLNWTRPDAYLTMAVLLALFGGCFSLGHVASNVLRPHARGAVGLALALMAITRVRQ
jgi:hypothetical protein